MKNKRRRSKVIALLLAVLFVLAGTMTALAEVSEPAGTLSEQVVEVEVSDTNLNGTFLPVCPYPWPTCPHPVPTCPVWVTVTFDMHDHGDAVEDQAWWSWVYVTEPDKPSEEGWVFDGWYADAGYNKKFEFNRWLCKDTTVHAKWTPKDPPKPETYTVSFNMNGYGEAVAEQYVKAGEKATKPADPTADGYTFEGWFADPGLTVPFDFGTEIYIDTTIYAKWEEKKDPPKPETYTVSFNMNGYGEAVAEQYVKAGEKATKPADPTEEGYTFEGWFDEGLTETFSFDTPINANTTIYAKWTEIPITETFEVSFNMNGHGEDVAKQYVKAGEKATKPADPTAEGYTFGGWYKESDCTNKFDFNNETITADTTIYAKWTANDDPTKPTPTDPPVPTYPVNPTGSPSSGNGPALSVPETSPVETAAETQLDVVPETGRNIPVILGTMAMLSALLYAGTRKAEDGLRRKKRKH